MTHEVKNVGELEGTIDELKKKQEAQQELLSDSVKEKIESLKPRRLIQSSFTSFSSNKPLQKKIAIAATTTIGIFLLKKMGKRVGLGGFKTMVAAAAISFIVKEILRNRNSKP